jgi:hypothetical protein
LKDSTYTFSLGFAGARTTETKFRIALSGADKGFLIKDLDGGVTLFDLQNLSLSKPVASAANNSGQQSVTRTDSFTKLLSKVSDDPSLLTASLPTIEAEKPREGRKQEPQKEVKPEATIVKTERPAEAITEPPVVINAENSVTKETVEPQKKEPVKADTISEVNSTPDSPAIAKESALPDNKIEPVQKAEELPFIRSIVLRKSESSTTEGFGLVFIDNQNGAIDTIRLLIPNQKRPLRDEEIRTKGIVVPVGEVSKPAAAEQKKPSASVPSTCDVASEKDFLRMSRSIAFERKEDRMIAAAKRGFRNKCFTTEQVRSLSTLFPNAAAKYQFFDAAFGHVSNSSEFTALGSEIKDEYYSKRFKALIGE